MPRTKEFDEAVVLQKAIELFWKKGYHATSIQDLVSHLGINRASLYNSFGDKKSLFNKAMKGYQQQNQSEIQQLLDSQLPVKEFIRLFLYRVIKQSVNDPDCKGCFVVNATIELAPLDEFISGFASDNFAGFSVLFSNLILKGQEQGEIAADKNPLALARFFFSTTNGLQVLVKLRPGREALTDIIETALSVLD
ncbi:MAG: TetR/AcrR family transcriptional regulator [Bacteroidota bacterium]